jgi:hypothetical protein
MILSVRNGTYTSMMLTTMQEHVYNVDWLYAGAGVCFRLYWAVI